MTTSGFELFPESDVGQMEIQVRTESGTPLQMTQETIVAMEEIVREETKDDLDSLSDAELAAELDRELSELGTAGRSTTS